MSNENIFNAKQDDQKVEQTNENNVGTSKKKTIVITTKGSWGVRTGNTYRFRKSKNKINEINGYTVYPDLIYKKFAERVDENNKKIVVLKLVGQEQTVEFYKDELYKNFGVQSRTRGIGRKPRYVACTDEEYAILKDLLIPVLRDQYCFNILKSNDMNEIKDALSTLE